MKSKFIKSTIILTIGGLITKVLGMLIKIVLTRTVSTEGIGLYMLVLPTFNLFITLATCGLPIAISKLVSEHKTNNKKMVLSLIPLILLYNFFLMLIIIFIAPILTRYFLNNEQTYYPLLAVGLTLPFISLSSIIKGYFFGKEQMFPHTLSNIVEQITRLTLTFLMVPKFLKYGLAIAVTVVVLINILSEFASIVTLLFFLPKNIYITKEDFHWDRSILKDILEISIPTTGSRLIGSICYFLEPIILTYVLLKVGYSNNFIVYEYGIINGYVYPLLLLPSFFTMAISNALLPVVSNNFARQNFSYTRNKIKQAIGISLLIGIPVTLIFVTIPEIPLKFIYNTTEGLAYIKLIAPFFLLHYIQSPLTASMQAMNLAKEAMYGTLIGSLLKLVSLYGFSLLSIGIWGLVISSLINIAFVTIHHLYYVNKALKKQH